MTKPTRNEPRSYVVRVYRRTARWFAGHVEDVRSGQMRPFRSAQELWSAIGGPDSAVRSRPNTNPNSHASRKESKT